MEKGSIIGTGNTAVVYQWEEGKVLKLFHQGYPKEAVDREFNNAVVVNPMKFNKPETYGKLIYEGRYGIIYDRIDGESLLDRVLATKDLEMCTDYLAGLHKEILSNTSTDIPDYKDFLRYHIQEASALAFEEKEKMLKLLHKLPEGKTLCHGDFHPGNVIISGGKAIAIDFMNVCRGNYLYDIARTVYLVQYTPVPDMGGDREQLLALKQTLADRYLEKMGVDRELIQDYLTVIAAARKAECPGETIN